MNMTDNDKELALSIVEEFRERVISGRQENESALAEFAHRYHTAKLEQAASGFEEAFRNEPPSTHEGDTEKYYYQSGAASQQPAIAAARNAK